MKKQPKNKLFDFNWRFNPDVCMEAINNRFSIRLPLTFRDFVNHNPYVRLMRLHQPVGIFLVMLPAWWAIAFASRSWLQILLLFGVFAIGAILMRGAGCIINDLIDRDLDKQVLRTMNRPLANGELQVKHALLMLVILLAAAFWILILLPKPAFYIGLCSIIPIAVYPLMKRITHYAQVFLGFTFNTGVLIGWFTVSQNPSYMPIVLYFAAILWTIGYDTLYAHQDKKYDLLAGMKSTALKMQDDTPAIIWKIYRIVAVSICIVGLNMHMNLLFYIIISIATYHLYWQTETIDLDDPEDCDRKFKSNVQFAWLVLIAILIGKF